MKPNSILFLAFTILLGTNEAVKLKGLDEDLVNLDDVISALNDSVKAINRMR